METQSRIQRIRTLLREVNKFLLAISVLAIIGLYLIYKLCTNTFWSELSIELIPVPIIFLMSHVFLREYELIRAREETIEIATFVSNKLYSQSNFLESMANAGIVNVYEVLHFDDIRKQMAKAEKHIKILQTFIDDPYNYRDAFIAASSKAGCEIQILLLNPKSDNAKERSCAIYQVGETSKEEAETIVPGLIEKSKSRLKEMIEEFGLKNITLCYYNSLPSVQLYIIDDTIYVSFFLRGKKSDQTVQIEVQGKTFFSEDLRKEFENRWKGKTPEIE